MKQRLLDHLRCPLDKTPLEYRAWDTQQRELTAADCARARAHAIDPAALSREIVSGVLVNRARKLLYPIHRGVPRMLTFATGAGQRVCRRACRPNA